MDKLTIDKIVEAKKNLLSVIENIYLEDPLLKATDEITISSNLVLPVNVFVNNSRNSCINDLTREMTYLTTLLSSIEEIKSNISELDKRTRSESLKARQRERLEKRIRSINESFESEKSLGMEQSIYGIYASFYSKIAYVHNKLRHQGFTDSWTSKHIYMRNAFANALMGEVDDFKVRLDNEGTRCFLTPVSIPIEGCENPIELHFGSEDNYRIFMRNTDASLSVFALERPELAYRAKLQLRYRDIQSQLGKNVRNEDIPENLKEPERESNKEKAQIAFVKYYDLKTKYEKEKSKYLNTNKQYKKEEYFQNMQITQIELYSCMRELMELSAEDEHFFEYVMSTPTLSEIEESNKNRLMARITDLVNVRTPKDAIDFLNKNPDEVGMIKYLFNGNKDVESFMDLLQEIKLAESEEKKSDLTKTLIYRCVGMGTRGENTLFVQEENGLTLSEQISFFLKSQGIICQDLDKQIQNAFEDKELIEGEGWDLGTETLTTESFLEILKKGMSEHNFALIDIMEALDYYKELDMFYGRDENNIIDIMRWKISKVLDENSR